MIVQMKKQRLKQQVFSLTCSLYLQKKAGETTRQQSQNSLQNMKKKDFAVAVIERVLKRDDTLQVEF